ncbi:ubiquitin-conjugating enzyme E2-16 kDa-like isoform X3 [Camellia sinensis]|uniref:ubiquitin-conjugating enzyme E2-16 kDa-like isoform X3 n=1 Tax=Camellia sinensis TaxID=4442 RepID=UPI00103678CD|nr:ubiquitin-conjugating enzyme E2-16 kDa-like isoform X3 [Camellia sinensis]
MSDLNLNLNLNPPSYCFAGPKGDSLYHWVATLIGPSGTPYEDGIFFLDITFPSEYPFKPPEANNLREMYVVPNSMPQWYSAQPTFQSLLQGSSGYDIAFRYSQESNSPMCI